ncbi:MAG TPA: flavodoxin family protein [Burkholderiaceae bacterium]|nr:flavodoxin family protein [Burkholderiaceae bacterium]
MTRIVVAFHSGYGHTRRVAEALRDGAASVPGAEVELLDVTGVGDAQWASLAAADAIVFGAPTYMGGASGDFKKFADASAKVWFTQGWKDKLAGGFTCSLNMSGDKYSTLMYFVTLAMQHGMIWVGTGHMPPSRPGDPDAVNRLGSSIGVMAQADNVPPEQSPPKGDLDTARSYGQRLAEKARRLRG